MRRPIIVDLFCIAIIGLLFFPTAHAKTAGICETGLFVNNIQLARAKLRLVDPKWQEDVQDFQARVRSYIDWTPSPYKGKSSWTFLNSGRNDLMVAMNLALYAMITSDKDKKDVANRSKAILLAWAHESLLGGQLMREELNQKQDYAGLGLYLGLMGIGASHAYQLLKCDGALSDAEDSIILDWLRRISEAVQEGQRRWETNRYFAQPVGNNHISIHNASLYAISVVIGDVKLSDWVLRDYRNPTSFTRMLDLAIYDGRERVAKEPDVVGAVPNRGEITDRYRMTEDKKGLHYAFFHLLALTLMAEVAANQGVDLYHQKAKNGETLTDPLLYYGKFLSAETCSTSSKLVVTTGPKGFEFYLGAPISPIYWVWIEPLMSHLSDSRKTQELARQVRATGCKKAPHDYLPIPFLKLTHAEDS